MKKFSNLTKKDSLKYKDKTKKSDLSDDVENLDGQIEDYSKEATIDGEWEIQSIIDISNDPPKTNEAIIINAEIGNKKIKRGDYIYITALINKRGETRVHMNQMGVLKVRVVEIYNTLQVLNQIQ